MDSSTIWALRAPSPSDYSEEEYSEVVAFLSSSIRSGISRFGWSYIDTADLNDLKERPWEVMTSEEIDCWNKTNFLLGIKKGDWIVHVNVPYWGACFAGQVTEEYSFEQSENKVSDFRHTFRLDPTTIIEFERNDDRVLPLISSRLKLQGRYWTISYFNEFMQTIQNLRDENFEKQNNENLGIFYLKRELNPILKSITATIQKNHPAGKLESLIAEVFRRVPNVINVVENGKNKGWGTDHGADIIVEYKAGLSIGNLEKIETLVVQVKSYVGEHWDTSAVVQIKEAIEKFEAASGLIITTADKTENLEKAIEDLVSNSKGKLIGLIAGEDVARFVLRYGGELFL